jgi:hypothetical protein
MIATPSWKWSAAVATGIEQPDTERLRYRGLCAVEHGPCAGDVDPFGARFGLERAPRPDGRRVGHRFGPLELLCETAVGRHPRHAHEAAASLICGV